MPSRVPAVEVVRLLPWIPVRNPLLGSWVPLREDLVPPRVLVRPWLIISTSSDSQTVLLATTLCNCYSLSPTSGGSQAARPASFKCRPLRTMHTFLRLEELRRAKNFYHVAAGNVPPVFFTAGGWSDIAASPGNKHGAAVNQRSQTWAAW
jgi:hypothetical protein